MKADATAGSRSLRELAVACVSDDDRPDQHEGPLEAVQPSGSLWVHKPAYSWTSPEGGGVPEPDRWNIPASPSLRMMDSMVLLGVREG